MKTVRFIAMALSLVGVAVSAHAKTDTKAVVIEAKDLKWTDMPGFPEVKVSTVEGDAAKGNHHAFMKFMPGFSAPLHHHSANHFVNVISGTLILTIDGKENRLPAGSYFSFKGKGTHATACDKAAECVIFADVRGKWDVVPEKK